MIDEDHREGDGGRSSTASEIVVTGQYRRAQNNWFVATSMSTPLVEIHLSEDVLVPVEA